jgi:hypothetical protein
MTIWRVRIACWIPRASDTHSGCVMLIALPLQQWMHESASILRYTCIANLVKHVKSFLSVLFYFSKFESTTIRRFWLKDKNQRHLRVYKICFQSSKVLWSGDFVWRTKTKDIFMSKRSVFFNYISGGKLQTGSLACGCAPAFGYHSLSGLSSKRYMRTAVVS